MTTTHLLLFLLSVTMLASTIGSALAIRFWRLSAKRWEAMAERLRGECMALMEDSNVRTAKTLREDIMVVAAHRTMLMEQAAQNVAEMDRLRRELRAARGVPERSEVEAFTQ